MLYTVRHVTKFTYDSPIRESVMEVRMQPRTEGTQRCVHFGLSTTPASRVLMHQDHGGNVVHHFNIPARHSRLSLKAEALVECAPANDLPERIDGDGWARLDQLTAGGEYWDMLTPSTYATPTPLLARTGEGTAARTWRRSARDAAPADGVAVQRLRL